MKKRISIFWLMIGFTFLGGLAACTRPLPGPNIQAATPTATRPFLTLPTATTIPPTQPLPTQPSPVTPTQAAPDPTAIPTQTPVATLVQPTQVPLTQVVAPVLEPETPDTPNRYRLKKDEFPFCIARRFDLDPYQLLRFNGLAVDRYFFQGQVLRIPNDPDPFPGNRELRRHPDEYRVRRGDSLYSIACYYGDVDPGAIAEVNGLEAPYRLRPGKILQIP